MRSLWPREHGAYAQLGVPLAVAVVGRPPTAAAILLAVGALLAFLANEPLLVVLGHRGSRAKRELGGRAGRRLAMVVTGAAAAGIAGLALSSPETRAIAGVVGVPAVVMLALAWRRFAHSLGGELVAALVLPGASAPIAVAAGLPWSAALALWLSWSAGYATAVIAVHDVIERRHRPTWMTLALIALACAALTTRAAIIALPVVVLSAGIAWWSPPPRRLRAIGVGYVIASVVSAALALTCA